MGFDHIPVLVDEVVDERIYNIALKNLRKFDCIINFDNYFLDVNNLLKKFNIILVRCGGLDEKEMSKLFLGRICSPD